MEHLTGICPGCCGFDGPVPSAARDGLTPDLYSNTALLSQVMNALRHPANALHWKAMARTPVAGILISASKAAHISRPRLR
jgi:hypothetical protein